MGPWVPASLRGSRLGADAEALDELGTAFAHTAGVVARQGWNLPIDLHWTGPDSVVTRRTLAEVAAMRRRLAGDLERAAVRLRSAAARQRRASLAAPAFHVLVDDRVGDGRLVQRMGPSDAPVVVVLVPGAATDRSDGGRLRAQARRVWDALAARTDDAGSIAVMSWLGYDAPDTVLGAIDVAPAAAAAPELAAKVGELRSAGAERVVVVGHSYGGVVAGRALVDGMDADAVIQLGSPGTGRPGVVAAARERGIDLRSVRAPEDPIGAVADRLPGLFGPDGVGLVPSLPTSGRGHSSYLSDPVLLDAIAQVALHPPGSPLVASTRYGATP